MKRNTDSARLIWLDSFMAAAAYKNYETAGKAIGRAATTVKRQVEQLEIWLHRILVTDDVPLIVTADGDEFVLTAHAVLVRIQEGDLRRSLGHTRVQADGTVTIEGIEMGGDVAEAIGKAMIASRAFVDPNYVAPPRDPRSSIIVA